MSKILELLRHILNFATFFNSKEHFRNMEMVEQGWDISKSIHGHLLQMCYRFHSQTLHHFKSSLMFYSSFSSFPLSSKTYKYEYKFDLDSKECRFVSQQQQKKSIHFFMFLWSTFEQVVRGTFGSENTSLTLSLLAMFPVDYTV